jgi:hypothetical protein
LRARPARSSATAAIPHRGPVAPDARGASGRSAATGDEVPADRAEARADSGVLAAGLLPRATRASAATPQQARAQITEFPRATCRLHCAQPMNSRKVRTAATDPLTRAAVLANVTTATANAITVRTAPTRQS